MKKIVGIALALFLGCGGFIGVKAASAYDAPTMGSTPTQTQPMNTHKWELMKQFAGEMHQLNQLQIKMLGYRQQIVQKHDKLMDLALKAREAKNKAAFTKAKPVRQEMKTNYGKMKQLHEQMHQEMKAFKEEVKNKNTDAAKTHLNNAIKVKGQINDLLAKQVELLNQLTSIFS